MRSGRNRGAALAAAAMVAALGLAGCGQVFGTPADNPPAEDPLAALMRQQAEAQQQQPPADPAAMQAFLTRNAGAPGVRVTPSGLQYKILKSGPANGPRAAAGDEVKVNYEGKLIDGTAFDASRPGQPTNMTVGQLVSGFDEALKMMRPGDAWMLYIPADLAYGAAGQPGIPGGSVLVFKLELVEILPAAGATAQG